MNGVRKRYLPAIIVFGFGLAASAAVWWSGSGFPGELVGVSLVLTGVAATLGIEIDTSRQSTVDTLSARNEELGIELKDVILYGPGAGPKLQAPVLYARDEAVKHLKLLLKTLERPNLNSVDQCLDALIEEATRPRRSMIRAVCGDKNHQDKRVSKYYKANYNLAGRAPGNLVKRIFFVEREKHENETTAEYEEHTRGQQEALNMHLKIQEEALKVHHAKRQIMVAKIPKEERRKLRHNELPPGVGFAIFDDDTVVVHWGLTDQNAADVGWRSIDPLVVDIYISLFNNLWNLHSLELPEAVVAKAQP